MKQYKYSTISSIADFVSVVLFMLVVFLCLHLSSIEDYEKLKLGIGSTIFILFFGFPFLFKQAKQKVFVCDDHVYFESFYYNGKPGNIKIPYKTIKSISIKNTPSIKPKTLKIVTDKLNKPILINSAFENHKKLFEEICYKTKKTNSDVVIDKNLLKYLGRTQEIL